jgi:hypothetical protein
MNRYLSAVGLSKIKNRRMLEPIYKQVLASPTRKYVSNISADTRLIQLNKDFSEDFGISLVGEIALDGSISIEYYFPYLKSKNVVEEENIYIEPYSDKRAYAGVTTDYSMAMTLYFFMTNIAEYEQSKWINKPIDYFSRACLSALSIEGTVILDVDKEFPQNNSTSSSDRKSLLEAAKNGDYDAIENLALEDMDSYNLAVKRTKYEDILTIVQSSFIPTGIETDHFSIIGNILSCHTSKNNYSDEIVYVMDVQCWDITFTLAINEKNLLGEPAPGRRFKGEIWLQGRVVI